MVHAALSVLLLHGGGWLFGTPANMDVYRPALPAGARVVDVDYALWDYRRAVEDARRAAWRERRRGRRVLAVGFSAGGSLAVTLAAERRVDATVAIAPIVDYTRWGDRLSWHLARVDTMAERRALSPQNRYSRASAPVRVVVGSADHEVPPQATLRFAAHWRRVRLQEIRGWGHPLPCWAVRPSIAAAVRYDLPRR